MHEQQEHEKPTSGLVADDNTEILDKDDPEERETMENKSTRWITRMKTPLAINIASLLIFGPIPEYFTIPNSLQDVCSVIFRLSIIFATVIFIDFALDRRTGKGIFPTLNIDQAIRRAQTTAIGSALVWIGYVLLFCTILLVSMPSTSHGGTLDRAKPYLPVLSKAINQEWPKCPLRHIPAGQVERESDWYTKATLKTPRELGRGLTQPTIAYDKNGKERFNAFKDAMGYKALRGWDWRKDPYNPGYQLKLLVLRDRDAFKTYRPFMISDTEAAKVMLVCYNAGEGRIMARRAYARLNGFKTDRWTGGLENAHGPRENFILYDRPLWKAVNAYPAAIFRFAEKYRTLV